MKKITEDLAVTLTAEELQERGEQISSACVEYDSVEAEKKASAAEFSDRLKSLRVRMTELAQVIRARTEMRPIECYVKYHTPEVGTKRIVRCDTNQVVRDEPMSDAERQNNLFEDIAELDRMFKDDRPQSEKPQ